MGTEQQEKMVDGHLRVSGESVLAGSRGIRLLYSAAHIQDPYISMETNRIVFFFFSCMRFKIES